MSFTTLPFLVLVALSVAAYYLLPQRVQWMALLAASMVFYCVGGGKTVLYVFYTAVIVYGSGLLLGRFNDLRRAAPKEEKKAITARYKPYRRAVVLVACLANFGLLYVLKYWNFTADLFQPLADQLRPGTQIPLSELVLPLGISFSCSSLWATSSTSTGTSTRQRRTSPNFFSLSPSSPRWFRVPSAGSTTWRPSSLPGAVWITPI
ncbi:MAG: hypothetical protein ACLSCQ_02220 [Evtepia gabavorous]